jgi:hypothetical protein
MSTNSFSGSALVVTWNGTVISGNQTNFSYTPTVNLVSQTSGADTHEKHLVTTKDGQATMEAYIQSGTNTGGTSLYAIIPEGASGTLRWCPEGTGTAKSYYQITAISQGVGFTYPFSNVVVASVSFQQDGARTEGTN